MRGGIPDPETLIGSAATGQPSPGVRILFCVPSPSWGIFKAARDLGWFSASNLRVAEGCWVGSEAVRRSSHYTSVHSGQGQIGLRLMANNFQGLAVKSLLAAGLAASAITVGCSSNAAQNPHAGGPGAMPVKVLEAKAVAVNDASEYVATVKSRDSAVI